MNICRGTFLFLTQYFVKLFFFLMWTLIYATFRLVILHAWFLSMNDYGICKVDTFNSLNLLSSSVAHKCQQLLISVFFFSASHLALTFFLLPDFSWLSFIWKTYLCRKTASFSLILVLFFFFIFLFSDTEAWRVYLCICLFGYLSERLDSWCSGRSSPAVSLWCVVAGALKISGFSALQIILFILLT